MRTIFTPATVLGIFSTFAASLMIGNNTASAQTIQFGIGNAITYSQYSYPSPYGNNYYSSKQQYLIRANEFDSAGISAPVWLTSIAFFDSIEVAATHADFSIRLKLSSQNELLVWEHGLTEVYNSSSFTDAHGWNTHMFTAPFFWDGYSNMVVEICYNNSVNKTIGQVLITDTFNYLVTRVNYDDYYGICNDTNWSSGYYARPDMRFAYTAISTLDAGFDIADWGQFNMDTPYVDMEIYIMNFGSSTLTSATLSYQLNGGSVSNYAWTGSVASGMQSPEFNAGVLSFTPGLNTLKVWVTNPNSGTDLNPANDTMVAAIFYCSGPLSGTYTLGGAGADFYTFNAAVEALLNCGVSGHVYFDVRNGIYDEQISITEIPGASASATITFRSESGDSSLAVLQFAGSWFYHFDDYNYTVLLDGADFIHFEHLGLKRYGAEGLEYARVVQLRDGASFNVFSNNHLESVYADGNNNWDDNSIVHFSPYDMYWNSAVPPSYNLFENNYFLYGSQSVIAESYSYYANGNDFIGNQFIRPYYYGFYGEQYQNFSFSDNYIINDDTDNYNYFWPFYAYDAQAPITVTGNTIITETNAYVYAIYLDYCYASSSTPNLIANNMISIHDLDGNWNPGIYLYRGSYFDVFHNSVVVYGETYTWTGTPFYAYNVNNLRVYNNIFNALNEDNAAYIRLDGGYLFSDNNNLYTTGTELGYINNTWYDELPDWQTGSGFDLHSISDSTIFVALDDLHIDTTASSAGLLNGKGKPGLIAVDIDGDTRSAIPDIGADEFSLTGLDAAVAWLAPVSPVSLGMHDVKLVIANVRSITITSVRATYTSSAGSVTQTFTGLNLGSGQSDTLTFTTQFSFVAQTQLRAYIDTVNATGLDEYRGNDTTSWINLCPAMAGNYTINASLPPSSTNFQTFNEAVNRLYCGGISAAVVFDVANGTYNEQVTINAVAGTSPANTITFRSASGDSSAVILSYSASSTYRHTLLLNGIQYLRIEGIGIRSLNSNYSRTLTLTNGTSHLVVRNCDIRAYATTSQSSNRAPVYSVTNFGTDLRFENNRTEWGYMAMYFYQDDSIQLVDNRIESMVTYGIYASECGRTLIEGNYVSSYQYASSTYGIYFEYHYDSLFIRRNHINLYNYYDQFGIYSYGNGLSQYMLIENNFILTSMNYSSSHYGIYHYYSNNIHIINNSIRINSSSTGSIGIYSYYPTNLRQFNNIIEMASAGTALEVQWPSSTYESDNNLLHTAGSEPLVRYNGSPYNSLAQYQSASGEDMSSLNIPAPFMSAGDLHIDTANSMASYLSNAAYPVPGMIIDFDGDSRGTAFDIGADEFTLSGRDATITWLSPLQLTSTGNHPITVIVRNASDSIISSLSLGYQDTINPDVTQIFSGLTILPGGRDTLTFTTQYNFTTSTYLRAYISLVDGFADSQQGNDTTEWVKVCFPLNGNYTINAALPASSTNFISFTALADALNCGGLLGPVIVNVADGTYNENFALEYVSGLSSTNTLTIQSNSGDSSLAVISYASTGSSDNYTVLLRYVSHIALRDLGIANTGTSYGNGLVLSNTDSITIENCDIRVATSYSSDINAIYGLGTGDSHISIMNSMIHGGYYGIAFNAGNNILISQNIVEYFHTYGIIMTGCDTTIIVGNSIANNTPTSYSSIYGIYLEYGQNHHVSKNKINLIRNDYDMYGVYLYNPYGDSARPIVIANNFLSLQGLGSGYKYGIQQYYGNYVYKMYNSLYVDGQYYHNTWGIYEYYTYYSKNYNNSVFLPSNGTVIYYYQPYNSMLESDYNNLKTNSGYTAYYNGSYYSTLTDYRMASGNTLDINSMSVNPSYTSPTDLHTLSVDLYNAGIPIPGLTDDIDGDLRNALTPDIGADEYELTGLDAGITWLSPISPATTGNYPVIVEIRNNKPTVVTKVKLTYTDGTTSVSQTFSGLNLAMGDRDTLTFSSMYALGFNAVLYATIDSINDVIDDVSSNDTSAIINICVPLYGTFSINPANPTGGTNFNSFNDAISQLYCSGISGPVIFEIATGTYNQQLTFTNVTGSSLSNTITFRSQTLDSSDVVLTYAMVSSSDNWTIRLNGANYFRFEHMSIIAGGSSYGLAIDLRNYAQYNTFSHCFVQSSATTSSNFYGFILDSYSDYNVIENCHIEGGAYGIYIYNSDYVEIRDNIIPNYNYTAIYAYSTYPVTITGNELQTRSTLTSTSYGIYLYSCGGGTIVEDNVVLMTNSYYTYGLYFDYCQNTSPYGLIINNMVSNTVATSHYRYGLFMYYSYNWNIAHNSVSLNTSSTSTLAYYNYGGQNSTIHNNIFSCSNIGYSMYAYNLSNVVSDYNDLFTMGTSKVYWQSSVYSSYSTYQTATGQDLNSLFLSPPFISSSNLHIDTSQVNAKTMNGAGISLSYVLDDIDGELRSAMPDMGADEYIVSGFDAAITWIYPTYLASATSTQVQVAILNIRDVPITSAAVTYTDGTTLYSQYFTGLAIAAGNSDTLTFTTPYNFTGYTVMRAYIDSVNGGLDVNQANDTTNWRFVCIPLSGTYTLNPSMASSGSNFNSFADLKYVLECAGLAGPTTINVATGTYVTQFELNTVPGISSTNTLLIQSAGKESNLVSIEFNGTSSLPFTVKLNGTSYVTLKHLTMKGLSTSYARALELANTSYITVDSCLLTAPGLQNSSLFAVYSYDGTNSNNRFRWSTMEGGYYCTQFNSNSNLELTGNTIRDFNYMGSYIYGCNMVIIDGNTVINNPAISDYYYGIYIYSGTGPRITNNRIQLNSNYTYTGYGIGISYSYNSSGSRGLIANNFISHGAGSGPVYGIYLYDPSYIDVVYNSINVLSNTSGSIGIYSYYNDYCDLKNNSIFMQNNGVAMSIYYGTSVMSNYNNLKSGGTYIANSNGTNYASLSAYQSGSGRDLNSISFNPFYISNTDLHSVSGELDSAAIPLAYVNTDIDGEPRDASFPDIGADEFIPPFDAADVFPLALNATISDCFGKDTVSFQIAAISNDSIGFEVTSLLLAAINEDFEPSFEPALWQSFAGAAVGTGCGAVSGTNALRFYGSGARTAQTKPLELVGGGTIDFYIRRGTGGSCETPDGGEDLNLQYSINGGSSWNTIRTYFNYQFPSFTYVSELIPVNAQTPNTILRWYQPNHSGNEYDVWAIDNLAISTAAPSVVIVPDSGTVYSGDTITVSIYIDMAGINVNDIGGFVVDVFTTDPRNPKFTVLVDVDYSGVARMILSEDSLVYGDVFVGDSVILSVDVINDMCDTLWVTNVLSSLAAYTPALTSFVVLPGDTQALDVKFKPVSPIDYNASLTVYSTEGDSIIYLKGRGEAPPIAGFIPASSSGTINCESSDTAYVTIKNSGLDTLIWSFNNVNTVGGIPFLTSSPDSGSVVPGDSVIVTLFYWRHSNAAGIYLDTIDIITNDPLNSLVEYPVTFNMLQNYLPIYLGNDTTVCAGAGVTLDAGSGYANYLWSTAANTQTIFVNTTGTYYVSASEGACTYSDTILVTVLPFLSVSAGIDTSHCPGVAVGLLATPTGGSGNFNYVWSPSTGLNNANIANPTANPSSSITYTVTVTDAVGCVASDQVVVETHPGLEAGVSTSSPICYGDSVDLLATPLGGTSPFTYTWSPGTYMNSTTIQDPKAAPPSSAYYYVTITDSKGCKDNAYSLVEVKRPYPNAISTPSTICLGDSARLTVTSSQGTAPYSYVWGPAATLSDPNNDTTWAKPVITSSYTVTVTDNMGCTNTDQVSVSVSNLTLNTTADDTICAGTSKTISAVPSSGAPYNYVWSPSAGLSNPTIQNPVATPSVETVYYVTVTNTYGCVRTDSVRLALKESPLANAGINDTICFGASTTLHGSASGGGSSTYSYQWSNYYINDRFLQDPTVNPYGSYTYTLTVTVPNGCTSTDQVYVHVYPSLTVDAGTSKSILQGDTVVLTASAGGGTPGYQYAWSPNDSINDSTLLQPGVWPDVTTQYTLYITDSKGCTKSDYTWVYITPVYNLSGTVTYLNGSGTPLDSVIIYKRHTSTHDTIDSRMTDNAGYYSFPRTPAGWVEIRAHSDQPWNGVNATDALNIRRHVVFVSPLTGVSLKAADVNASGTVTSLDALNILLRTIHSISSFAAGDWVFYEQKDIYMPNSDYTYNLFGLCMGDVNGSNPSPGDRLKPTVHLALKDVLYLNGSPLVDVPIYVDQDINLGAVTLVLDYPAGSFEVLGVKSSLKDIMYNDLGGQLRIAWSDVEGKDLRRGDLLLTLEVKRLTDNGMNLPITVSNESEFADKAAIVNDNVKLTMPALRIPADGSADIVMFNFPNPFIDKTEILYQIPEDGDVMLEVFNALGEKVGLLEQQWRSAGSYTVGFSPLALPAGIYSYRLTFHGVEKERVVVRTMVVTK